MGNHRLGGRGLDGDTSWCRNTRRMEQEDRRIQEDSGRQRNSSGSKSRILAFVLKPRAGASPYTVWLHYTVLYCTYTVLYCTVLCSVSAVGLTQYTVQLCRQGHVLVRAL